MRGNNCFPGLRPGSELQSMAGRAEPVPSCTEHSQGAGPGHSSSQTCLSNRARLTWTGPHTGVAIHMSNLKDSILKWDIKS